MAALPISKLIPRNSCVYYTPERVKMQLFHEKKSEKTGLPGKEETCFSYDIARAICRRRKAYIKMYLAINKIARTRSMGFTRFLSPETRFNAT